MTMKLGHNTVITALLAVLLLSAAACSDRNAQARLAMAAADSLMTADPQAALDTLKTIDSSDAASLPRADRAFYTLLRTEAGYKCYLPVAGNTTAISEAADYYRRKGPEDLLARALVMQGAVLFEQGDTDGAMLAYKEAEPLLEHSGDLEQLGLLHTRIGALYKASTVNDSAALTRYYKAMECFEKAELHERQMSTHLSIATMLFILDSSDKAVPHLEKGLSMAEALHDTLNMLSAYSLYAFKEQNTGKLAQIAKRAEQLYEEISVPSLIEEDIINNINYCCAELFMDAEKSDSALLFLNCIRMRDKVDSLSYYTVMARLHEKEDNTKKATECLRTANDITLRILKEGYDSQLIEVEKKYDNDILSEKLKVSRNRIMALTALLLLAVAVSVIIYLVSKNKARKRELILRNAVNDLQSLRTELLSKQDETTRLHSRLHDTEAAMEHLKKQIETEAKKHNQEAEELKNLRESFVSQATSNQELLTLNGKMLGMTKTLADICYIYEGSPNMPGKVEEAVKSILSDEDTLNNILGKMLELTYPGFMTGLSKEYPSLNDSDRKLIVLTCCGFSSSTASIILGISVQNLNARKYRIARKMGIDGRISSFVKKKLSEYSAPVAKPA